ncbi:MAG: hypothetical protein ABIQ16_28420 [Polyangiaceae bacterium]
MTRRQARGTLRNALGIGYVGGVGRVLDPQAKSRSNAADAARERGQWREFYHEFYQW